MSEKRGDTGKLIYDFNECWLTEVQNKKEGGIELLVECFEAGMVLEE